MRRRAQYISLLVITALCASVTEASVLAKKKPKRRTSRARAEKSLARPTVIVVPSVITTTPRREASAASQSNDSPKPTVKASAPATPVSTSGPTVSNATATAGQLIISEFRFSGPGLPSPPAASPNADEDEFIEIYNASGADHTVQASSGSGYAIVASDGGVRCVITNGTVINNKGHFLCANSDGYSLTGYPENDPVAQNASYTTDIPENSGIALFDNNTGIYTLATRLDAVGSTSAGSLYREGAGYPPLTTFNLDYSFVRDKCGKGGNTSVLAACTLGGLPKDTSDNAADFYFIDTSGTNAGAGQRLGAPGPQALFTNIERNSSFSVTLLDPCVSKDAAPNRDRDNTPDPGNNATFGTLSIRRTVTNNTGVAVSKLRFRIVDITTTPSIGVADLRARTSSDIMVTVDRPPCGAGTSSVPVYGATLQNRFLFMGPAFQPNGGAMNSLLSVGQITIFNALQPGDSIDVHFLLGVQQTGTFRFYVNIEVFP
ncbi:MAG: hypothetical protein ACXW3F_08350 [Pyrinomonadaceae bacterium]